MVAVPIYFWGCSRGVFHWPFSIADAACSTCDTPESQNWKSDCIWADVDSPGSSGDRYVCLPTISFPHQLGND